MKKFILLGLIIATSIISIAADNGVYGSLTSIDQLNRKVLKPGQFAYYQNDGAIEMFVGSSEEYKNLRVCDPAALSGYRIRDFDYDLAIKPDPLMTIEDEGSYKFLWLSSMPLSTVYIDAVGSTSVVGKVYYTKSGDTYVVADIPVGTNLNGDTKYYETIECIDLVMEVFSRDAEIYKLTYDMEMRQGGLADFNMMNVSSSISYNGAKATITFRVTGECQNKDWFIISNIKATTLAIGDRVHTTDLSKTKIYIKDKEWYDSGAEEKRSKRSSHFDYYSKLDNPEGFDLSDFRYWAKHLYDGNRGENWSVYPAYHDVIFNTFYGLEMGSVKFSNNSINRWKMISVDGNLQFTTHGIPFIRLEMLGNNDDSTQECAFTRIHQDPDTKNWILEFSFQNEVEPAVINILWRPKLEYGDWMPIGCTLTYNNAKTDYTATVPAVYSEVFKSGFWKIYVPGSPSDRRLRVNATISVMASDGKYYKLTFPSGGGAVTATLDENQGY